MARCHRIGQDKDVTVYRLITDNTYEQNVFECSTRKQGDPQHANPAALYIYLVKTLCLGRLMHSLEGAYKRFCVSMAGQALLSMALIQ